MSQYNPTLLSRINDPTCEDKVRVIDERPTSCNYDGQYNVWYPVIIENFNFKEDIPNEWMFNKNGDIDDQGNTPCNGGSYYGPNLWAYNNGNFDVSNGIGHLKVKNEYIYNANSSCPGKMYHFTNAVLYSEFNIKQGFVYAKLKLPENPYMWPAFWLQKMYPSSGYSEIDVFEFYDHDWRNNTYGNCDSYHQMRMTIHENKTGSNSPDCKRGRKFPVSSSFFSNFHQFELFYTDYLLHIYVDYSLKGIATKYYEGPFIPITLSSCNYSGDSGIPSSIYSCGDMQNLQGCNTQCWGGIFGNTDCCWQYNHVYKDLSFPAPSYFAYQVRISNWLTNDKYKGLSQYLVNELESAWNNFSDIDKEIQIDNIIIYQPIKCYKTQNITSVNAFKNETGNTNFLSGSIIKLSNYQVSSSNIWPTYLLATNEIEITPTTNDVLFEEGTFLRAEIIDCSTGISGVSQRLLPNGNDTLPPVLPIDYFDNLDTLADLSKSKKELHSQTDNGALQILPNPAQDQFYILLNDEDWYDLQKIELSTPLGQTTPLPKDHVQTIAHLPNGLYFLKFYFSNGMIVVKPLVVQR